MEPKISVITTDKAPTPAGHYAQGVLAGQHLYISGQLPVRADGSLCLDADFQVQATQAVANMLAILQAAGGAPRHLVKVTAYIVGVANWPAFNAIYASLLPDVRPARTVVPVSELHHGFLVEVDAVAVIPSASEG